VASSAFVGRVVGDGGGGGLADPEQARRALALLVDPGHLCHLTASPHWPAVLLPGGDPAALLAAAERLGDGKGVFFGLNPLKPGTRGGVNNGDVLRRRWLLIDSDPIKPDPKVNASEAEHDAAQACCQAVFDWLGCDHGWPAPLLIDSGNGWHLLYRIDLPNDRAGQQLVKRVLLACRDAVRTPGAQVDDSTHDARRLAKVPGCWVRKGPHSDERPHRPARLVYTPPKLEVVTEGQLRAVAALASPDRPAAPPPRPFAGSVGGGDGRHYARAALSREAARCAMAGAGMLNNTLFRAGAAMGNLVASRLLSRQEVFTSLLLAIRAAGANDPAKDEDTLTRAIERGMETPRVAPERIAAAPSANGTHAATPPPAPETPEAAQGEPAEEPVTIQASMVERKRVAWLWPGRIPLGKLTTVAGPPGVGKTFFVCDLAARVTTGCEWPDAPGRPTPRGSVLVVSAEDDPEDTLAPRLAECGADLTRVYFFRPKSLADFSLAALGLLQRAVDEADGVRLVAIDPPTSFVAGVDDHKNADLRKLLTPLSLWASKQKCAVVFITHLNKGGAVKTDALTRVSGSIAWVAATRAAYLAVKDPDDEGRRILATIKMNLAPEPKTLAYRIVHQEDREGRLEWLGPVEVTADQAVNREAGKPRKLVARDWLLGLFTERLEWPSGELFRRASEDNVSKDAVFEAKRLLGLPRARRTVRPNGDVEFVWWVPPDWPHLPAADDDTESI